MSANTNKPSDLELFPFLVTPEMKGRLTQITRDVIKLLKERVETPEEIFVVLDQVTRSLAEEFGVVLVAPLDEKAFAAGVGGIVGDT